MDIITTYIYFHIGCFLIIVLTGWIVNDRHAEVIARRVFVRLEYERVGAYQLPLRDLCGIKFSDTVVASHTQQTHTRQTHTYTDTSMHTPT